MDETLTEEKVWVALLPQVRNQITVGPWAETGGLFEWRREPRGFMYDDFSRAGPEQSSNRQLGSNWAPQVFIVNKRETQSDRPDDETRCPGTLTILQCFLYQPSMTV